MHDMDDMGDADDMDEFPGSRPQHGIREKIRRKRQRRKEDELVILRAQSKERRDELYKWAVLAFLMISQIFGDTSIVNLVAKLVSKELGP